MRRCLFNFERLPNALSHVAQLMNLPCKCRGADSLGRSSSSLTGVEDEKLLSSDEEEELEELSLE